MNKETAGRLLLQCKLTSFFFSFFHVCDLHSSGIFQARWERLLSPPAHFSFYLSLLCHHHIFIENEPLVVRCVLPTLAPLLV